MDAPYIYDISHVRVNEPAHEDEGGLPLEDSEIQNVGDYKLPFGCLASQVFLFNQIP